jgi:hypothetical protein
MMQITFNTPYGFSPDSTPEETRTANRILRETLKRLNGASSGARATLNRSGRCFFTFDLPSLFCTTSSAVQDGEALEILMGGLTALNEAYLSTHHGVPSLYTCGVIYGRTDIWDTLPALYARGYGDCKSVSACLVAEYRKQGRDCRTVFRWIRTASGTKDYHILVLTNEGFEDPSKVLGMGRDENS